MRQKISSNRLRNRSKKKLRGKRYAVKLNTKGFKPTY
jgi:hypothetical protein